MRRITTFVGGGGGGVYETKNEWKTMSMINKITTFITQYTLKKIECMFLNVTSRKLQCSGLGGSADLYIPIHPLPPVFMKVSRSEPISLTCLQPLSMLQPGQSLITLFYFWVAPLLVYITFRMI
jgi:hypothetical protein